MSVQTTTDSRLYLQQFLNDLHKNNQPAVSNLEKKVSHLGYKILAYNLLEKISYIALFAILATILTVSYSGVALTGSLPLIMAGMAFSTPVISWGLLKVSAFSQVLSRRKSMEEGICLKLKEMSHWTTSEVQNFLTSQGIAPIETPLLKKLKPNEPLCALIPLIACFNHFQARAHNIAKDARIGPTQQEEKFAEQEALGKPCALQTKEMIRAEAHTVAANMLEQGAIPSLLNAAVIFRLLQNPHLLGTLDIAVNSAEIPGLGICVPKSFASRLRGRFIDQPRNDDYFYFKSVFNRSPMSRALIEANLESPRNLCLELFGNPIRE